MESSPPSSFGDLLASDDFESLLLQEAEGDSSSSHSHSTRHKRLSSSTDDPRPEDVDDCYGVTGFGEGHKFFRHKRKKLEHQNQAKRMEANLEDRPQCFAGLAVYINGLTEELGLSELKELFIVRGGRCVPYLDRKSLITHIVASNLTPAKRVEFASYKVATPLWLVDSARQGRLLDWRKYSLLAPKDSERTVVGGGEEADRMGTQTAQRSLVGFLRNEKASAREEDVATSFTKGRGKAVDQTRESLSERGVRLAQSALAHQSPTKPSSSTRPLFAAPPIPSTSTRTTPAKQLPRSAPISPRDTDASGPTTAAYLANMPTERSDRTTALLQDSDWLAKHSSTSPDFIENYFDQSRLHHLSLWKGELKQLVADTQPSVRPVRKKDLTGTAVDAEQRTVFHIDFDCFFVSAGLVGRPELRGKPVAVCHAGSGGEGKASTSEIASCSYEARALGVKNGMSLGRAREFCPDIQTIPYEFEVYKALSAKFYTIALRNADFLQAVSIDEVLIEVATSSLPTSTTYSSDPAFELAYRIRAEIHDATSCEVSIGISHNILLARLATHRAKPANAFHLLPSDMEEFLAPLPVERLPGIGWELASKLAEKLEVEKVGDLLLHSKAALQTVLGPTNGDKYWEFARGIDARELEGPKPRGSVSAEINYGIRFSTKEEVKIFLLQLAQVVSRRLKAESSRSRLVTLKIKKRERSAPIEAPKLLGHGKCTQHNVNASLSTPTDDPATIGNAAWKLMESLMFPPEELRGIAIQMRNLKMEGVVAPRERGQGTLTFGVVANPAQVRATREPVSSDAEEEEEEEEVVAPPPQQQPRTSTSAALRPHVSIVIISDSDDSPPSEPPFKAPIAAPLPKPPKPIKAAKPPKVQVPAMFKQKKKGKAPALPPVSEVTDADLEHFGIDPEFFRAVPLDVQLEEWTKACHSRLATTWKPTKAQARKALEKAMASQPKLGGGQVTKPGIFSSSQAKSLTPLPSPTPPPLVLSSPPPITDEEIAAFGIDVDSFRELPPSIQRETYDEHVQRKKAFTVAGIAPSKSKARTVQHVDFRAPPPIRFGGKVETDDIRTKIEAWIEASVEDGPANEDVDKLATFLEKCASRTIGRDLAKAADLLAWWKYLIDASVGKEEESEGVGRAWWEAWRGVRNRVERVVRKEFGSSLAVG